MRKGLQLTIGAGPIRAAEFLGLTVLRFLVGVTGLIALAPVAIGQGSCGLSGPTLDEVLASWHEANKKAELDRSAFLVVVQRGAAVAFTGKNKNGDIVTDKGRQGTISVNGKMIGESLENEALKIPAGEYRGVMRYGSQKNFVAGPLGVVSEKGDFLLEVANVAGGARTDILFHNGSRPWHSKGCVLVGAARKVPDGKGGYNAALDEGNVLRELRKLFYGTDAEPTTCPRKAIRIVIRD